MCVTGSYLRNHVGKVILFDNREIRQELGIEFTPVEQSFLDTAEDLLRWGIVERARGVKSEK